MLLLAFRNSFLQGGDQGIDRLRAGLHHRRAVAAPSANSPAEQTLPRQPGTRRIACRRLTKLVVRNLLRQRSRNLLLGTLILFSAFVIACFSMFLAGVQRHFSHKLVALATGGAQILADVTGALQLSYAIVTAILMIMVGASLAFTTLLNIMERTQEIATMAALGASAKRIRRMLVCESMLLALVAELLGLAVAAILYTITAASGISIANKELAGFLGSAHFHPAWNGAGFAAGLLLPLTMALLASSFFAWRASRRPIAAALAAR